MKIVNNLNKYDNDIYYIYLNDIKFNIDAEWDVLMNIMMPLYYIRWHSRGFQQSKGFNFDRGTTGKRVYVSIKADRSLARSLAFMRYAACTWLTPFSPVTREYLFLVDPKRRFCARLYDAAGSHYVVKEIHGPLQLDRLFNGIARPAIAPPEKESIIRESL